MTEDQSVGVAGVIAQAAETHAARITRPQMCEQCQHARPADPRADHLDEPRRGMFCGECGAGWRR